MNENKTNINWYPGHMVKSINEMIKDLKYIDIVLVILDSRIPYSSKNEDIYEMIKKKTCIMVFNKSDMADPRKLKEADKYYKSLGMYTIKTNSKTGEGIKELLEEIKKVGQMIKYKNKTSVAYLKLKPVIRVLVTGIPNVGKSTLINKITNKVSAKVANKPGITLMKQWIKTGNNIEIMDTPGLLWPRLDKNKAGIKLAICGNIKDDILDVEELAIEFIKIIRTNKLYMAMLKDRYNLNEIDLEDYNDYEIINKIGESKNVYEKGGFVNILKTSRMIIEDYRDLKIGNISLE